MKTLLIVLLLTGSMGANAEYNRYTDTTYQNPYTEFKPAKFCTTDCSNIGGISNCTTICNN